MTEELKDSVTPNETNADEQTSNETNEELTLSSDELDMLDDDTSKKFKTAIAQKQYWRDKFKEQEEASKKLQGDLEALKPKEEPKKESASSEKPAESDQLQAIELRFDNPKLTMDQVKMAMKYANVEGKTPQEIIKSPYFQSMVNEESRENRVEDAITNSSDRGGTGTTNFEKIAADDTGELYKALTPEKKAEFRKYQVGATDANGLRFVKR